MCIYWKIKTARERYFGLRQYGNQKYAFTLSQCKVWLYNEHSYTKSESAPCVISGVSQQQLLLQLRPASVAVAEEAP